ncbi:MAG: pitrilysin family protein [Pseudomonadota bacterium]
MIRSYFVAPILGLILIFVATFAAADVNIKEVKSPGGHSAWLVENDTIPFVALELRFQGGASLDAEGKRGAINLMTGLLEEGAGDLDARAFQLALEEEAASFSYDVSDDSLSVSARFLTETMDSVLPLLKASITNPRFDEAAIERVRAQVLSGLKSDETDPDAIAGRNFSSLVFGNHPYGSSESGTIESVSALTRDDLVAAHRATMAQDRVFVSAVGDITKDQLAALLDKLLADLPATGAPLPGDADLNLPGGVQVVNFETPQSTAIFAQPGIPRDHPDYFPVFVLNHIVGGGGFESYLMDEVRAKRGLTYGVYSYLVDKDGSDLWMGSVASSNDRVAEAIEVIRDIWQDISEGGLTQEQLDDAKTYMTGAYPLRFDSNRRIANITASMQVSGMPIDYIATRNDRVNAVTLEDLNRVAKEWMDPDRLTFVVVGQPENLNSTVN